MNRFPSLLFLLVLAFAFAPATHAEQPNNIFIMADDQGVGDVGCYGSKHIQTPAMDKLAAKGMRFTNCYSGSAVYAPTRCVLMTGLHPGHCTRRDNTATGALKSFEGRPLVPLSKDDVSVATSLKKAGYATAGFGKWGLGNPGTTGTPDQHGFDYFYGYLDQVHAHTYYPDYLVKCHGGKIEDIPFPNNAKERHTYSHDVLAEDALRWVRDHHDKPFFLYLPYCPPHGKYEVPDQGIYKDKKWSEQDKNYAAMITRMDEDIAELMALLKELSIDENTIVFYTSDNGPNPPFLKQFNSAAGLRGVKRQLWEGGIRCPMIARWPGKIAPGTESDLLWSHVDFFATACDLADTEPPKTDGVSVLPTLLGKKQTRESLYWEIHHPFHQAVRIGHWKGVRFGTKEPLELYNLTDDPTESKSIASDHPDIVTKIEAIMDSEHADSKFFPAPEKRASKKGKAKKG